jgi:hypothetical protein
MLLLRQLRAVMVMRGIDTSATDHAYRWKLQAYAGHKMLTYLFPLPAIFPESRFLRLSSLRSVSVLGADLRR